MEGDGGGAARKMENKRRSRARGTRRGRGAAGRGGSEHSGGHAAEGVAPRVFRTPTHKLSESEIAARSAQQHHKNPVPQWPERRAESTTPSKTAAERSEDKQWRKKRGSAASTPAHGQGRGGSTHGRRYYDDHMPTRDVAVGLERGWLKLGELRVNPHNRSEAYATIEGEEVDWKVEGFKNRNRAFHGDVVVLQRVDKQGNVIPFVPESAAGQGEAAGASGAGSSAGGGACEDAAVPALDDKELDSLLTQLCPLSSPADGDAATSGGVKREPMYGSDGEEILIGTPDVDEFDDDEEPTDQYDFPDFHEGAVESRLDAIAAKKRLRRRGLLKDKDAEGSPAREEDEEAGEEKNAKDQPRTMAKVVSISVHSHQTELIGRLSSTKQNNSKLGPEEKYAHFLSFDPRVPRVIVPLKGRTRGGDIDPETFNDHIFRVKLNDHWGSNFAHPFGQILECLGERGDRESEFTALLVQNKVTHTEDFGEQILGSLPPNSWTIPESEYEKRRDVRDWRIFSIDPTTAKDLDDALSCEQLPNGNWRIGVHIADVTHFVQQDSPLDMEARDRATTVYLVTHSIPMLPRVLSENLCSLAPGSDKLAFSVVWEMTKDAEVKDVWFGRTVMRSCGQLSYGQAQELIDDTWDEAHYLKVKAARDAGEKEEACEGHAAVPASSGPLPTVETMRAMQQDVIRLNKLAIKMRRRRFENGSLTLESPKLFIKLDENDNPVDVFKYERGASHLLVEEFMLLANISVGRYIHSVFPNRSLLRRHEKPNPRKMDEYLALTKKFGFNINASSSAALHESFKRIGKQVSDELLQVLMWLGTKPMQTAKYVDTAKKPPAELHHYALNFPIYTHFTSPIRRYADVVVHRVLQAALSDANAPFSASMIGEIAANCNERKICADKAQEQCDVLFLNLLLREGVRVEQAVVTELTKRGMVVVIPKYGLERHLPFQDCGITEAKLNKGADRVVLKWADKRSTAESSAADADADTDGDGDGDGEGDETEAKSNAAGETAAGGDGDQGGGGRRKRRRRKKKAAASSKHPSYSVELQLLSTLDVELAPSKKKGVDVVVTALCPCVNGLMPQLR